MRISDWSSDVCSSDLIGGGKCVHRLARGAKARQRVAHGLEIGEAAAPEPIEVEHQRLDPLVASGAVYSAHHIAHFHLAGNPGATHEDAKRIRDRKSTRLNSSH